jgi:hypothetical protein
MVRILTIGLTAAMAGVFGWGVPLARLCDAFQPMTVALSIMIAAVLVRLNRGMPTLDWKTLDIDVRKRLTSRIVELTGEYGWIIALNFGLLVVIMTLTIVGASDIKTTWPPWLQRVAAAVVGGGATLCVVRMAYVVWRDIDIVKLQRQIIDDSADKDLAEREATAARDKVANIQRANLRRVAQGEPTSWDQ